MPISTELRPLVGTSFVEKDESIPGTSNRDRRSGPGQCRPMLNVTVSIRESRLELRESYPSTDRQCAGTSFGQRTRSTIFSPLHQVSRSWPRSIPRLQYRTGQALEGHLSETRRVDRQLPLSTGEQTTSKKKPAADSVITHRAVSRRSRSRSICQAVWRSAIAVGRHPEDREGDRQALSVTFLPKATHRRFSGPSLFGTLADRRGVERDLTSSGRFSMRARFIRSRFPLWTLPSAGIWRRC